MTFHTVTFKGFQALVTARVVDGYSMGIVYLEIAGAEAEVRAIWSRLVSGKTKKTGIASGVEIGDSAVRMEQHTKYITLRTVLSNGQHLIGLLHPRTTVIENDSQFYLVVSADHKGPPPAFFPRLAQSLTVPIKEEWAGWLWERGQEVGEYEYQKLIRKLISTGHVVGYTVRTHDAAKWLKLIQEGLGFEVCDWCSKPAKELVKHVENRGYGLNRRDVVKMICKECKDGKEES